jgi:hypothetical protein
MMHDRECLHVLARVRLVCSAVAFRRRLPTGRDIGVAAPINDEIVIIFAQNALDRFDGIDLLIMPKDIFRGGRV